MASVDAGDGKARGKATAWAGRSWEGPDAGWSGSPSAVARDYLEATRPRLKPRSYTELERNLQLHWAPFASASIYEITRRQVASHVAALVTSSGPVAAAHARSALGAMFNWALREGYELPANPVAGSNSPAKPPSRARVLTDAELRKVWHACGDDDFGRIICLLALLGQRREEVGGMEWTELSDGVWTIPAVRTKNSTRAFPALAESCPSAIAPAQRPAVGLRYRHARILGLECGKAGVGFARAIKRSF